jgi:hypothetical protein
VVQDAKVGPTNVVTAAARPDLLEPAWEATKDLLPEYNNHGDVLNVYWPRLTQEFPDFQFHLIGDDDGILARARCIPLSWDGTPDGCPHRRPRLRHRRRPPNVAGAAGRRTAGLGTRLHR